MNLNTTIQFGLDLATSISVIAAAVSFVWTQCKARKQAQYQFTETNLWHLLDFIRESSRDYKDITDDLRVIATQHKCDAGVAMASEAGNGNVIKLLFLTEKIKRELQAQQEIYLPLFFNAEKEMFKENIAKFDDILRDLNSRDAPERFDAILQTKETILEVEKDIVKKLHDILPKYKM